MKRTKGLIAVILIYTLEQAHSVSEIEREGFKPVNSERRICITAIRRRAEICKNK